MASMLLEIRQAARRVLRSPGYGTSVVLTLALGLGAVATVFALIDGVLLQPLPYAKGPFGAPGRPRRRRGRVAVGVNGMNNLKSAIRQQAKRPGLSAIVVVTLALGVGANAAMLSQFHQAKGASPC